MTQIPDQVIARLLSRKLLVSGPFDPQHVSWPDGRIVYKPRSARGNRIPYFRVFSDDESIAIDAPTLRFFYTNDRWCVARFTGLAPGPDPHDFTNRYDTPDEAIDDILDYYFGDISRMLPVIVDHVRRHKKRFEWEWRQWERRQLQQFG